MNFYIKFLAHGRRKKVLELLQSQYLFCLIKCLFWWRLKTKTQFMRAVLFHLALVHHTFLTCLFFSFFYLLLLLLKPFRYQIWSEDYSLACLALPQIFDGTAMLTASYIAQNNTNKHLIPIKNFPFPKSEMVVRCSFIAGVTFSIFIFFPFFALSTTICSRSNYTRQYAHDVTV